MDNGDTFCTECMSEICKIFDLYLDSAEYFKHPLDQGAVQEFKKVKKEPLSAEEEEKLRQTIEKDLEQFENVCECSEPKKTEFSLQELGQEIEKAVNEVKAVLKEECAKEVRSQIEKLTEKFELVLRNEQMRTTLRFHEADRLYGEKIGALRNHLECKNMAALMYVLSNERRTCKLETAKLVKEFNDREAELIHDIDNRDQLLDSMLKEHRLATMVNAEWQDKMTKLLSAFHKFIAYALDRTPDSVQFFLDVPALLGCAALEEPVQETVMTEEAHEEETTPVQSDGVGDICMCGVDCDCELAEASLKGWWEMLQSGLKPFIVYGDLSGMPPQQRRQVLATLPGEGEAQLDTCVLNDRMLKAVCGNKEVAQAYYDIHPKKPCPFPLVSVCSWDAVSCIQDPPTSADDARLKAYNMNKKMSDPHSEVRLSVPHSDGSIVSETPAPGILAAKDSLEIVSSTRLLTKERGKKKSILHKSKESLKLDAKKSSVKEEPIQQIKMPRSTIDPCGRYYDSSSSSLSDSLLNKKKSKLGSLHKDSISLIVTGDPNSIRDKIIDKACPVDACARLRAGPYLSNLPPYMWPGQVNYDEDVSFEQYKPCTQAQIDKLLEQHAATRHSQLEQDSEGEDSEADSDEMSSDDSLLKLAPPREHTSAVASQDGGLTICECDLEDSSRVQLKICGANYGKKHKDMLNEIPAAKLWSNDVEMKRMHVLGSEDRNLKLAMGKEEFMANRVSSIKKILADYPSMCSLFQGTSKCV